MDKQEITKKIKDILEASFDIKELQNDEDLSFAIDSLDEIELVINLEDSFSITIDDIEWKHSTKGKTLTISFLEDFVYKKLT